MSFKLLTSAAAGLFIATMAFAQDGVHISDAYARAAGPNAKAGAAFMVIENHAGQDDRLVSAASDVSARVELHTHIEDANGVMQMREVENGFEIPSGGSHTLERGGDHVMFMGLNQSLNHGDTVEVILTFEKAGDVVVEIPVDLERKGKHGSHAHGH